MISQPLLRNPPLGLRLIIGWTAMLAVCVSTFAAGDSATKVTGPITGGTRGTAFAAPDLDLKKFGYTVEEFFIEGQASTFDMAAGTSQTSDGKWKVERSAASAPYKTRLLVVRPLDARNFNGTVIVHWQNVTAGYELGSVTEGEYLRGYAWVGVSAQKVGIDGFPGPDAAGLKVWDAQRYGSLSHPGDDYSFDIYTQAGRLVGPKRAPSATDPLGKLPVKRLIAAGASQSAGRLRSYINGIHPLDHVFDAYIPYIDFARVTPFIARSAAPPPAALNGSAPIVNRPSVRIRDDLDVPVFVVNSETETESYFPARQPDSAKFHFWEVTGASHVSVPRAIVNKPQAELRPGVKIGDLESPNWLSYRPAYDAAIRHMQHWLLDGKTPPSAKPIEVVAGQPAVIQRDAHGNAKGGIRLPDFAVETAEHRGSGVTKPGGYRLGFLYGFSREYTAQELKALYPDAAAFMKAYDKSLQETVTAGYVLKEDAPAMRATALAWSKNLN